MTASNSTALLDTTAATIREHMAAVEKANGDSLLANRMIGDALVAAKELLDKEGKGAFGKWIEDQGFGFGRQWRSLLMSLSVNWKAIQKEIAKHGPVKSVEKAVALVKAQPIKKDELPKLLTLLEQAEAGDEAAQAKLDKAAKAHKVQPEVFQDKLDALKAKQEAPKEKPEVTIARLTEQLTRLMDLLTAHGIDPNATPKEAAAE